MTALNIEQRYQHIAGVIALLVKGLLFNQAGNMTGKVFLYKPILV